MNYWLLKSEPSEFGIDDLAKSHNQTAPWTGVRNYQARNFLRDGAEEGDLAFFYHSSCPEPGVAGVMRIVGKAHPDPTQFEKESPYYDPKSTVGQPRWIAVDVQFVKKTRLLSLEEMRGVAELSGMRLLARGNRLSVMPVTSDEADVILGLLGVKSKAR